MKTKILILGLVCLFALPVLASLELTKPDWEDKGTASVVILSATYDEVWERVLDVLLIEKFKPKGASDSTHEAISIEKDAGFIIVKGFNEGAIGWYRIKVTLRQKDCNVFMKCAVNMAQKRWRKTIIEEFFQLLEKEVS